MAFTKVPFWYMFLSHSRLGDEHLTIEPILEPSPLIWGKKHKKYQAENRNGPAKEPSQVSVATRSSLRGRYT